jgi:hypothetical protein
MKDQERDEALEEWLRSPEAHLENEGFSHRVLEALPRRRRLTWRAKRRWVKGISVVVGLTVFVAVGGAADMMDWMRGWVSGAAWLSVLIVSVPLAIGASCVWACSDRV